MINVSSEYKSIVADQDTAPQFTAKATVTLADSTVLNITDAHIVIGGLKIDDATSDSNKFQIGSVIINQCTLAINNIEDEFSDYDFTGAVIRPDVGLVMSNTTEWMHKGVFTVDDPGQASSIITITALDNMAKADKSFKGVSIVFPTTAKYLLMAVCGYCGIPLSTLSFFNEDYPINERPLDDAITCREVISWIAQIACCYARCNKDGSLELKWYDTDVLTGVDGGYFDNGASISYQNGADCDGGNFIEYSSGVDYDGGTFIDMDRYHHIYSLSNINVATDDVVITGLKVTNSTEPSNTVPYGQDGYVISIEGNKLIQSVSDAQRVAITVGAKIVGMRFRPLSITAISDPSREAGDVAFITDRKQNTYPALLTNVTFEIGKVDKITCDAESPLRNSAERFSEATKTYVEAKKHTDKEITSYDLVVQQITNLVTNGFGMFKTEIVDGNGGIIYYMHDKKLMDESSIRWFWTSDGIVEQNKIDGVWTTVYGTDKEGNALVKVLTAIGINADWIKAGKIYSTDGATLIDLQYGVANSDNISFVDNIQNGFPLLMPFNIDDNVSKINKVLLKYTQQNYRTYSTTTSGGGSGLVSSSSHGLSTGVPNSTPNVYNSTDLGTTDSGGSINQATGTSSAVSPHAHNMDVSGHSHNFQTLGHSHSVSFIHSHDVAPHSHTVDNPAHTHELDYGIMEASISDNTVEIYVDNTLRATVTDLQGIVDLTAFITTIGWHAIELRSSTLKRISAQINIKSYIRS